MLPSHSFHHIGILTRDLGESLNLYERVFLYERKVEGLAIPELEIQVACLERADAPRIELIQPMNPNSTLGRMAIGTASGYHLAWAVEDLEAACAELGTNGFHALPFFESALWNGARCGFSIGPTNELVEFVEGLSSADRGTPSL